VTSNTLFETKLIVASCYQW